MAVKTHFSGRDFAEILSRYDLGEYRSSQPIPAGTVQTNYHLFTTRGRFVFRCYENRTRESAGFEAGLLNYLSANRYPCPAVYPDRRGIYVGVYRDKPYALFEFIEGQPVENPAGDQQRQLVLKAAELQNLTRGFRPANLEHRWNYDPGLCLRLAREAAERNGSAAARQKLSWFEKELRQLDLPATLPKGICHCDFHFSNVLFKDGEFVALLDFDDANYTYLAYDLATLIEPFRADFTWATWQQFPTGQPVLDFRQAQRTAAEYQTVRVLEESEKRHLFDIFKLSVFFDAIWYFDRGEALDFYEKRKFDALNAAGRAGFRQAVFADRSAS